MDTDVNDEAVDTNGKFYRIDIQKDYYDYNNSYDYEDIHKINEEIVKVTNALYRVTEKLNMADRMAAKLNTKYEREFRHTYLSVDGKTEAIKKAKSELACEYIYEQVVIYKQVVKELERSSQTLRNHLQVLQALSNNVRQQMKV